jgi:hypothetical protein
MRLNISHRGSVEWHHLLTRFNKTRFIKKLINPIYRSTTFITELTEPAAGSHTEPYGSSQSILSHAATVTPMLIIPSHIDLTGLQHVLLSSSKESKQKGQTLWEYVAMISDS